MFWKWWFVQTFEIRVIALIGILAVTGGLGEVAVRLLAGPGLFPSGLVIGWFVAAPVLVALAVRAYRRKSDDQDWNPPSS